MAYIVGYWANAEERARQAQQHTVQMLQRYRREITQSVKGTKVYKTAFKSAKDINKGETEVTVIAYDTVRAGAAFQSTGKVALLNFASYKNPGGKFLEGSKAQEECLCHASYLYNVLACFTDFYEWNCKNKNKALYFNRALYSPDILFQYGDMMFKCDVITCAAPNKTAAQKWQYVSDTENTYALQSRIRFVLDIAKENEVDTLILGAYGCGVFGQDASEVAEMFKKYLNTAYANVFQKVVFAIPEGSDGNLRAFQHVFDGM